MFISTDNANTVLLVIQMTSIWVGRPLTSWHQTVISASVIVKLVLILQCQNILNVIRQSLRSEKLT